MADINPAMMLSNLGGPWGLGLQGAGLLAGGIIAHNQPSEQDLLKQRGQYLMSLFQKYPQLHQMFLSSLMRGSGGQQANILGASNAFKSGLSQRLVGNGLTGSGIGAITGSLGDSMTGLNMANLFGNLNSQAGNMANQGINNMVGTLGGARFGNPNSDAWGSVLKGFGDMTKNALYPRG
jgi:hypothetical protein